MAVWSETLDLSISWHAGTLNFLHGRIWTDLAVSSSNYPSNNLCSKKKTKQNKKTKQKQNKKKNELNNIMCLKPNWNICRPPIETLYKLIIVPLVFICSACSFNIA